MYEARASQYALRKALRSRDNFGKRFIVLTDSIVAAVSFDKGRATCFKLRRVLQQTAALVLATGIVLDLGGSRATLGVPPGLHRFQKSIVGMIHRNLSVTVTWDRTAKKWGKPQLVGNHKQRKLENGLVRVQLQPTTAPSTWDIEIAEGKGEQKQKRRAARRKAVRAADASPRRPTCFRRGGALPSADWRICLKTPRAYIDRSLRFHLAIRRKTCCRKSCAKNWGKANFMRKRFGANTAKRFSQVDRRGRPSPELYHVRSSTTNWAIQVPLCAPAGEGRRWVVKLRRASSVVSIKSWPTSWFSRWFWSVV